MAKLVCFAVSGQEVAAPIGDVRETVGPRPLTRVFLVPDIVAGLINLRGEVVAVIELATLLGLSRPHRSRSTDGQAGPIVIIRTRDTNRNGQAGFGLLVDRMVGTREVSPAMITPVPKTISPETALHLSGVATLPAATDPTAPDEDKVARPLLILDPARIIETERLRPFRSVSSAQRGALSP